MDDHAIAVTYAATGVIAMGSAYLSRRFGTMEPTESLQLLGTLPVLALPLAPWLWLPALENVVCMAHNLGSRGSRNVVITSKTTAAGAWPAVLHRGIVSVFVSPVV